MMTKNLHELMSNPDFPVILCDPPKSPNPTDCQHCGGRGVEIYKVKYSGPYPNHPGGIAITDENENYCEGELFSKPCPVCKGNRIVKELETRSGLSGADQGVRLKDVVKLPGNEKAISIIQKILSSQSYPCGIITFYGGYGTGKTFLVKASINEIRIRGLQPHYACAPDLLGGLRKSFSNANDWEFEKILEKYKSVDVLALDEVDKVNITPWALETLFRIVDMRYELRAKKLTIFTLNTKPDDLPEALGYLSSRVQEGIIIEMAGPDVRPAKGLQILKDLDCD